jgi:hypothetical protein
MTERLVKTTLVAEAMLKEELAKARARKSRSKLSSGEKIAALEAVHKRLHRMKRKKTEGGR